MECNAKSVMIKDFLCEKNFPYGNFFLHPDFHGLNIFYTVLHTTNMDHFMYFNYEKTEKLNCHVY